MRPRNGARPLLGNLKKAWDARHPSGILCHRFKFIYYPIAKAANSSMRVMIAEAEGLPVSGKPHLVPFDRARVTELNNYPDYKRVVVVRNPWSRLYACYKNKIYWKHIDGGEIVRRTDVFPGFARYNRLVRRKLFHPDMTFDEFARIVARIPDAFSDRHFRSQYKAFCQFRGPPLVDSIVRMENFQEDMQAFLSGVGADDLELKHLNSGRKVDYAKHFDEDLVNLVARRYRRDLELLDYTKP